MKVDLLFVAKNRLEFTRESFSALLENTNRAMARILVYDDGSTDGTCEYLAEQCEKEKLGFYSTRHGSPVAVFNSFIRETAEEGAEFVAKIDSDCMCPPSWLSTCIQILEDHPILDCLGIEAFTPVGHDTSIKRTYEPYRYTGGIGVFRRAAFRKSFPAAGGVYFGFQVWQERERLTCGWVKPALAVFLLDHLPFEPWRSLSKIYIQKKWQRKQWGEYPEPRREGFHEHGPDLWSWRFPEALEVISEVEPVVVPVSVPVRRPTAQQLYDERRQRSKDILEARRQKRAAQLQEEAALKEEIKKPIVISIVIPTRTDEYLESFLVSLSKSQPRHDSRIFIADDGLSEEFRLRHPELVFVPCERPFCFAKNVNLAVKKAQEINPDTHILIQNDDTQIESLNFIDSLREQIPKMKVAKWAAASPQIVGNCGNVTLKKRTEGHCLTRIWGETIPFISVLITNEAWQKFEPLDERFVGYGFDDVAWCFKATAGGYKLGWTSAMRVKHEGSATFKEFGAKLEGMSREAREVFFRHYNHPLSKTFAG